MGKQRREVGFTNMLDKTFTIKDHTPPQFVVTIRRRRFRSADYAQDLTDPRVIKRDFSSSSRTRYTDTGVVAKMNKVVFLFYIPLGQKKEKIWPLSL